MYYLNNHRSLVLLAFIPLLKWTEARHEASPGVPSSLNRDCACGFYDSATRNLFTDALIVYFNETTSFPAEEFSISNYTHKYEKGWNTIHREGSNSTNVQLGNSSDSQVFSGTSLELFVDPSNDEHLVVGGEIRSIREDMQYGSFSALLKGPPRANGGSAMSMMFRYNETQEWDVDLLNTNDPQTAWLATLFAGEFPDRSLGVNYSILGNASLSNYTSSPWDFIEVKVNWNEKSINYSVGGVLARSVTREEDSTIPSVPGPLLFKHWSNGDKYESQGPPYARAMANVGWIRSFFNSSTTTKAAREAFDDKCDINAACLVSDISIRGSTSYTSAATVPWKQKESSFKLKIFAIVIVTVGSIIGILVVSNATIRRVLAKRRTARRDKEEITSSTSSTLYAESSFETSSHAVNKETGSLGSPGSSSSFTFFSGGNTVVGSGSHTAEASGAPSVTGSDSSKSMTAKTSKKNYSLPLERNEHQGLAFAPFEVDPPVLDVTEKEAAATNPTICQHKDDGKNIDTNTVDVTPAPDSSKPVALHGGKPRIDYMAGIVAICSLMVTFIHFSLTFLPALESGYDDHNKSTIWAERIIAPYFLNAAWLGLFFTTSTRFLTGGYLVSGNLKSISQKTVTRAFRLIIPVAGIVILEYFLIDCGVTQWLEYLPSITWSTWPYTVRYKNFGEFLNELLELLYLIPNAAPQITFNYCTGVLWTIPVTLQGSWISLLGVMIVYQIKNPWKRTGYYATCILVNWYAREWGSFFWAGIVLTDLDVTYKYRKWVEARPIFHWFLLITCLLAAFTMLSWDAFLIDANIPLLAIERGIHPDLATGRPISQTANYGYPAYYEPRLNGLIFAVTVQLAVEISPFLQKVFSSRILMWIFPHIFTIYLFHGLVFWSLGATICFHLSLIGVPYWANMLVTAVSCWGTLFLSLNLLTPAVEMLGIHVTAAIWRFAQEGSAKKEATIWPFEKEMLLGRESTDPHVSAPVTSENVSKSTARIEEIENERS